MRNLLHHKSSEHRVQLKFIALSHSSGRGKARYTLLKQAQLDKCISLMSHQGHFQINSAAERWKHLHATTER